MSVAMRAEIVGMLTIKVELVDKNLNDKDRVRLWTAQAVEVLLRCELARIDAIPRF